MSAPKQRRRRRCLPVGDHVGNELVFSGEWWITIVPGAALVVMALAINLLGDWLRDALNPKLR